MDHTHVKSLRVNRERRMMETPATSNGSSNPSPARRT